MFNLKLVAKLVVLLVVIMLISRTSYSQLFLQNIFFKSSKYDLNVINKYVGTPYVVVPNDYKLRVSPFSLNMFYQIYFWQWSDDDEITIELLEGRDKAYISISKENDTLESCISDFDLCKQIDGVSISIIDDVTTFSSSGVMIMHFQNAGLYISGDEKDMNLISSS